MRYSEEELNEIKNLVFSDAKIFLKDDVTKDGFFTNAKDYSIIHLSTHGKLKASASDSYLVLSGDEDNKLTLREISGYVELRDNVTLAVLSACETALDKDRSIGKEFLSISKAFARAGVPTVIASLWKISDESTKMLFTEFYKNLKEEKMNKAEALRQAQINLKEDKKYAHPFYWASFIMLGDYR